LTLSPTSLLTLILLLLFVSASAQKITSRKKKPFHQATYQSRISTGPNRLHFCGETVPTEQGDVSTKLAFALASNAGYARHINSLKNRSAPYFAIVEPILQKHSIPSDFKYLPLIESDWHANAVSSAGAVGYWQFMDETAQDMGLSITPGHDERTDLRKSTEAACIYLKLLYRKLGSWTLVAAAYNGGIGMIQRKIAKSGQRDYYTMAMNAETGHYLYRILAMKELFVNPSYGIGSVGIMLASAGNAYEKEREQARQMGWLQEDEPEPEGISVDSFYGNPARKESVVVDSLLTELLKSKPRKPMVYVGDVATKLVKAGPLKVGKSWAFTLTEDVQIGEDALKIGDILYAVVDDVDARGNLFLRATKAIPADTKKPISLTLLGMNPGTGMAGLVPPKNIEPGWIVQWKL
jgi:membrane-bound lytic murein transglycosylase D